MSSLSTNKILIDNLTSLHKARDVYAASESSEKKHKAKFKLNITFYLIYYLYHNCSVNLNWNDTQPYSSAKPLRNVPSSVFRFANFCFLPFLCRTSIQKWKENWFCYVGKKETPAKISKCLCQNLLIGAKAQIRAG